MVATRKKNEISIGSLLSGAFLYIALPNFVFQLLAMHMGVSRPFIDIDYLFAGMLFAYGWQKSASVFLLIFLIIDALVIQGLVYPVLHPKDVFYLVKLLPQAPAVWQIAAAGAVATAAAVVFVSAKFSRKTSGIATLMILGGVVVVYALQLRADAASSEFERNKNTLAGSQVAYYINTRATMVLDAIFEKVNPLYPIGFDENISKWFVDGGRRSDKLLLVVAESWGLMKDPAVQRALLQPIYEVKDRLDWIEIGDSDSKTTTVDGELRYLCGLGIRYINLKPVTDGFSDCLPWELKSLGYTATAVHGASGSMHERKYWYPRLGFDEIYFGDTEAWKTRCYSFPGICDREILDTFIPAVLGKTSRQFVYWLTLNTHAPYDRRDIWMDAFNCKAFAIDEVSETCRLTKLHAQFFLQLARVLTRPEMEGLEVFVVGDHSPPLLNQHEFRSRFVADRTPYLYLRVKQ